MVYATAAHAEDSYWVLLILKNEVWGIHIGD